MAEGIVARVTSHRAAVARHRVHSSFRLVQGLLKKVGQRQCNGLPRGHRPHEGKMTMERVSRPKNASHHPPPPETRDQGDLAKTLLLFAAWRPCSSCGDRVLYVDENAHATSRFVCGRCQERLERFGAECAAVLRRPHPKRQSTDRRCRILVLTRGPTDSSHDCC
jgi:hypothetical protein